MTTKICDDDQEVLEGDLVWSPSVEFIRNAQMTKFVSWLEEKRDRRFSDYQALWHWSVANQKEFWRAIWDYFEIISDSSPRRILHGQDMFATKWFEDSRTNYAEHLLRHEGQMDAEAVAIFCSSEVQPLTEMSWKDLGNKVRLLASRLRELGIAPGDRIASYMPNTAETVLAMIATVAIGAVWSSAAPEFGAQTVIDRFSQIEPKLIFVADGYSFNGREFDRCAEIKKIVDSLGSLEFVVWLPYINVPFELEMNLPVLQFNDLLSGIIIPRETFRFERVPPDHPLWILYSSGTTGLPKAIVHGHAGMIAEHLKAMTLHCNLGPTKRLFFYSTTGWMMWNVVVAALIAGATAVLYDGSPTYGGPDLLWQMAAATKTTCFGVSPTYVQNLQRAGVNPSKVADLSSIDTIMLGGSPAAPETFRWLYENVKSDVWICSQSGGTDLCSGFGVGVPTLPVYAGEIQALGLGMDVHIWSDDADELIGQPGELVVTKAFPSAPLCFWGDVDNKRYFESYFTTFPGVWRHGDLAKVNIRGGLYVYGRSDATLNRFGVRIGTSEIYNVLNEMPAVADSLVVCCERPGGAFYMPLFVLLDPGRLLTEDLKAEIASRLRRGASPRHVPDEIHQVWTIPYTLTGKKMEIPVRRLLMGVTLADAAARDAMARPDALDWYVEFARHITERS